VVKTLRAFARNPYSTAFLFDGETGTGKTSTAVALASALGCAVDQAEFGGLSMIASGEQTAAGVQETCDQLHNRPFSGSGWRVVIVNEADKMTPGAEAIWLDRLEQLPRQTVVVFTTNFTQRLPQRFLDRCQRLKFDHDPKRLCDVGREFLKAVFLAEAKRLPPAGLIDSIVTEVTQYGEFSFRRALQLLTPHVLSVEGGAL
jgi:DNA polymerase III delta prime subunit